MKKNKIIDLFSYIESDLFSQTNIELIEEKMQLNIPILLSLEEYIKIQRDLSRIHNELIANLSSEQINLLNDYDNIEIKSILYQNSLAYYLGIKTKEEIDKLK